MTHLSPALLGDLRPLIDDSHRIAERRASVRVQGCA